jgi:peptide/nickel transport system substrate-binding protein
MQYGLTLIPSAARALCHIGMRHYLAKSWEFSDPNTFVIHLRQGVHWQNIPPANGREFTADDVMYHYDRMLGLGYGFTKPNPFDVSGVTAYADMTSITTSDKYTVIMKWRITNPVYILETVQAIGGDQHMENLEAVNLWGDLNDWHHAIGTGPFILKDFVSGSSATLVKNPNYWGYDERYPQNQLPYVDSLKYLIMPNQATVLAAMRTGKIDVVGSVLSAQAQSMKKTNPAITQISLPSSSNGVDPRNDAVPFKDIKVRQALQMSIDLPTIASTYYGGVADPWPSTIISNYMTGWGFPYNQWPQELKDQYAYNPTAAKQLLASAGYPNGFNTNCVADNGGDLDLLQIVKSYFAAVGVNMTISTMDTPSWVAYVQTGHKQDALAYRNSGSLGNTYEPIRQLNRFKTGYPADFGIVSDPVYDAFIPAALAANSEDKVKQVIKDACEYAARQHFAISLLCPNAFALCQPWLKGYSGQFAAIASGPSAYTGGFYAARFWIDPSLKKSMGF